MDVTLRPIGTVRGGRDQPIDDDWGESRARLELDPARFAPDALAGLADFSHAEVIFLFDRVPDEEDRDRRAPAARAGRTGVAIGIFAQRGMNRPNRLGVTARRIVAVDGLAVEVGGLDAIDGTRRSSTSSRRCPASRRRAARCASRLRALELMRGLLASVTAAHPGCAGAVACAGSAIAPELARR